MCEVAKAILDGKVREIMKDLKRRPAELRREIKWRIRILLESSRSCERGRVDVRKLVSRWDLLVMRDCGMSLGSGVAGLTVEKG